MFHDDTDWCREGSSTTVHINGQAYRATREGVTIILRRCSTDTVVITAADAGEALRELAGEIHNVYPGLDEPDDDWEEMDKRLRRIAFMKEAQRLEKEDAEYLRSLGWATAPYVPHRVRHTPARKYGGVVDRLAQWRARARK